LEIGLLEIAEVIGGKEYMIGNKYRLEIGILEIAVVII